MIGGFIESIISELSRFVIACISRFGYGGIVFTMAVESACIPLPSEIIMPFSGYLVTTGQFTMLGVTLAGAVGNVIGSIVAYYAGVWGGRPFVDALQVEMARPVADQMTSIEVGRADFVALRVQDVRRASQRGLRMAWSGPLELVALVFADNRSKPHLVRRALSLAVDRQTEGIAQILFFKTEAVCE